MEKSDPRNSADDGTLYTADRSVSQLWDILKKDFKNFYLKAHFRGHQFERFENLKDNENFLRPIPTNFTLNWTKIQPLNVQGGPNVYVKRYVKNKFGEWYSTQVTQVLDRGKEIDEMKFL